MSIVDRLVAAVSGEDIDAFGALYADDAVLIEPLYPEPVRGKEAIMEGEKGLLRAFSEVSIDVRNEVSFGRGIIAELVLSATNDGPLDLGEGDVPATGRRVQIPMVWVLEVNDEGLVKEERDYFDTALIMRQLGLDEGA